MLRKLLFPVFLAPVIVKRVVDAVTPSMQARWPPAEAPKRSGSRPHSAAFARRKRTAALTSSTAAGNRASPESR